MQFHTALHNDKPKPRARNFADIAPPLERIEYPLLVLLGNADAVIDHFEANPRREPRHIELHRDTFGRILHRIRQQISQNVAQQAFIRVGVAVRGIQRDFYRATTMRRRKHFVHQAPAEGCQIKRLRIKAQAARFHAAQEQHLTDVLGRLYGRQVGLQVTVDPDVLGGLIIQVGDEVIDGSIAHRLEAARRRLAG